MRGVAAAGNPTGGVARHCRTAGEICAGNDHGISARSRQTVHDKRFERAPWRKYTKVDVVWSPRLIVSLVVPTTLLRGEPSG